MALSGGTTRLNDMPQFSRSSRPVSQACVSGEDMPVWWHLKIIFSVVAAPGLISGAVVLKVEVPAHVLLLSGAAEAALVRLSLLE